MAGTRAGGTKAARTNKLRYGAEFYMNIGRAGGRKSRGGGFAKNPDLARMAGRKGGLMSRRRKSSETTESAEQA
jgi:general stress protein YciG